MYRDFLPPKLQSKAPAAGLEAKLGYTPLFLGDDLKQEGENLFFCFNFGESFYERFLGISAEMKKRGSTLEYG